MYTQSQLKPVIWLRPFGEVGPKLYDLVRQAFSVVLETFNVKFKSLIIPMLQLFLYEILNTLTQNAHIRKCL